MIHKIYGKDGCQRCVMAKALMPEALYSEFHALYDDFDLDTANAIVAASNGELPIIVIERHGIGRLVLGPSKATKAMECNNGACSI